MNQNATSPVSFDDDEAFIVTDRRAPILETSGLSDGKPKHRGMTESGSGGRGSASPVRLVSTQRLMPSAAPAPATAAPGTVIAIEEGSIACEIVIPSGTITVNLLPDLFPESPTFGMPFTLEMVEVRGIQQPRIVGRKIEPVEDEISREMRALLERL